MWFIENYNKWENLSWFKMFILFLRYVVKLYCMEKIVIFLILDICLDILRVFGDNNYVINWDLVFCLINVLCFLLFIK